MHYNFYIFCFLILFEMVTFVEPSGMSISRILKRSKSIDEYKVYPLIFIKTDKGFRLPIDFDHGQKTERAQGHKRKFRTHQNESEVFFCPAARKTKKDKKRRSDKSLKREPSLNHEVSQVCTVEKSVNENRVTLDLKCDPESEPVIWEANVNTGQNSKKSESIFKKYTFGYKICTKDASQDATHLVSQTNESALASTRVIHFGIYDFFYDILNNETYMTIHEIRSRALLFHKQLEKERRVEYIDDTYGYDFFEDFSARKELFDAIGQISDFKTQKLIPVDDFPFALWRKTTYHYLNTDLMHQKLQKLWDSISDLVRDKLQYEKGKLKIYTGAFRIPIPKEYRDLIPKNEIIHKGYKIPQMWVKFLHYMEQPDVNQTDFAQEMVEDQPTLNEAGGKTIHKGLAIIANNYLDDKLLNFIRKQYCLADFCKNFAMEEYPDIHRHIRCCFFDENILRLIGLRPIFSDFYKVEGLFKMPPRFSKIRQ